MLTPDFVAVAKSLAADVASASGMPPLPGGLLPGGGHAVDGLSLLSLGSSQGHNAIFYAVVGGILWGVAPLAKRYSVDGAPEKLKLARSAATFLVCTLGNLVTPVMQLMLVDHEDRYQVLTSPEWLHRAPLILFVGGTAGLGGLMCTCALALAGQNTSALICMVENGVYAVLAGLLIAGTFREHPSALQWASAVLIVCGILTMNAGGESGAGEPSPDEGHCPAVEEGTSGRRLLDNDAGKKKQREVVGSLLPETALIKATKTFSSDMTIDGDLKVLYGSIHSTGPGSVYLHASGALVFAVAGGLLMALGPCAKRWGVDAAPVDMRAAYASCTAICFFTGQVVTAGIAMWCTYTAHPEGIMDTAWRMKLPVIAAASVLGGLGNFIVTYALAAAGNQTSSIVAMVADGVFTVCGALLVAFVFRERPSWRQLSGTIPVIAAILLTQFN